MLFVDEADALRVVCDEAEGEVRFLRAVSGARGRCGDVMVLGAGGGGQDLERRKRLLKVLNDAGFKGNVAVCDEGVDDVSAVRAHVAQCAGAAAMVRVSLEGLKRGLAAMREPARLLGCEGLWVLLEFGRGEDWAFDALALHRVLGARVFVRPAPGSWGEWDVKDLVRFEMGLLRLHDYDERFLEWCMVQRRHAGGTIDGRFAMEGCRVEDFELLPCEGEVMEAVGELYDRVVGLCYGEVR